MELYKFVQTDITSIMHFPADTVFAVKGFPNILTDSYALDFLYGPTKNRIIDIPYLQKLTGDAASGRALVGPVLKGIVPAYTVFVFQDDQGDPYCIQSKYFLYFYHKYPESTYTASGKNSVMGVIKNSELVGLVMPVCIDNHQIKEFLKCSEK